MRLHVRLAYSALRTTGPPGKKSWVRNGAGASIDMAADIELGSDGTIYASLGIMSTTDGIYSSSSGNLGS